MGNYLPCCRDKPKERTPSYTRIPLPRRFPVVQPRNKHDLHGYSEQSAMEKVKKVIRKKEKEVRRVRKDIAIEFVTGRGKHSKYHVPVIRNAVKKYLDSNGYEWDYEDWSEGSVIVLIPYEG